MQSTYLTFTASYSTDSIAARSSKGPQSTVNIIGVLITGLIAGWLAGHLMSGKGFGIIADIVLGLVGAVIGNWLFRQLDIDVTGMTGLLAAATVGAVILVAAAHLVVG